MDKASAKPAVANKQLSPEEMARLKVTICMMMLNGFLNRIFIGYFI